GALTEIDLSSLFAVEASALTSGSYTYTVSGSNATITAYSGTASTLSIPSTLGGYTVTAIEHNAFTNNAYLTSVTIPGTVTRIGYSTTYYDGPFQGCKKLQSVTFSTGSKNAVIGPETFMGCISLQSVTIPGNYTTIKENAFSGCTALQSMTWKKSDYSYANQVIEQGAFSGCTSLASISLPTTLKTIGAWAFNVNAATSITIPEGVTTIGHSAFMNCPNLTSVSLPSTITNMGYSTTYYDGTFQGCKKLKTVIFAEGSSNLTIGPETFKNCSNLTTVHLPLNLVEIKEQAFDGSKTNLTICSKSNSSYGKTYADSNSIKFKLCNGSHTTTPTTTYTVTYNANGGSISPSSVSVKAGESVSLPIPSAKTYTITYNANGGSGAPSAQSFAVACKGWSTSSTATSASYACGTKYTPTKNVTLYAVWNNATDATVSTKIPMRAGYSFRGWSTVSNATTPTVGVGSEWSITSNITLYAVWEKISTPTPSYKEENVSMNYKDTMTVNGAVSVETSNSGVASVSGNKITAADTGSADVTVTYEDGSVCVYHINVSYSWWQWIIVIVLFGWIWY
ncbi:MAG: leucine-rich repeat protein, partial [Clostridia bacterium]|nr:leucine-rich repeat protein [Clostridia bacterium]